MGECEQNSYIKNPEPQYPIQPFYSTEYTHNSTSPTATSLVSHAKQNTPPIQPPPPSLPQQQTAKNQGVLVKRCRILEDSKCISVCLNSCKIPTQDFFRTYMGMNLTMVPNYETGECQFQFGGDAPTEEDEAMLLSSPCYHMCPSGGSLRKWHNGDLPSLCT